MQLQTWMLDISKHTYYLLYSQMNGNLCVLLTLLSQVFQL